MYHRRVFHNQCFECSTSLSHHLFSNYPGYLSSNDKTISHDNDCLNLIIIAKHWRKGIQVIDTIYLHLHNLMGTNYINHMVCHIYVLYKFYLPCHTFQTVSLFFNDVMHRHIAPLFKSLVLFIYTDSNSLNMI